MGRFQIKTGGQWFERDHNVNCRPTFKFETITVQTFKNYKTIQGLDFVVTNYDQLIVLPSYFFTLST